MLVVLLLRLLRLDVQTLHGYVEAIMSNSGLAENSGLKHSRLVSCLLWRAQDALCFCRSLNFIASWSTPGDAIERIIMILYDTNLHLLGQMAMPSRDGGTECAKVVDRLSSFSRIFPEDGTTEVVEVLETG